MALIEGVGDEVTLLFGVAFLALVLVLAWASTHTADRSEHLFAPAPAPGPASSHRTAPSSPESASPEPLPPESAPTPGGLGEEGKDEPRGEAGAEGQAAAGGAEVGDGSPSDEGFGSDGLRHREPAGPAQTSPSPSPAPSQPSPASTESAAPDDAQRNMVLRLKFLNDTERVAQVKPEDTIGYIKRTYFTGQEHQVRLIYQGQLLRDDAQTLASLNLADNCVLHCHVSQHATPQVPAGARAADQVHVALNVGSLMVPFFVLMLSVLWYFQIQYRQFFTATATASLVGLTIFFSFVAFGLYRR
ncbi:transmembrane and ubiquitin-like domain-containing protein 1 [Anguilla anguilla]|uniref:transmembrane and ubiquitin-like domain-containing protein 1 n=1 Tax=Anguilla anguilla TaxID=7936 RepID=UPI0015AB26FF|nr:transmembrane and ubiquitin-like domain-containing protein 1 [Anguilla anguilla]XP_035284261.1 transmembrane and ubiquitin-like domain-containing protein 1 [Anguilla anguilla]